MPTGRIADLKRFLPPSIKYSCRTIDAPDYFGNYQQLRQNGIKVYRVTVIVGGRTMSFDDTRLSKAVKLAISYVCCSQDIEDEWLKHYAENGGLKPITMASVLNNAVIKPIRQIVSKREDGARVNFVQVALNEIGGRDPKDVAEKPMQECRDCGITCDPIYIVCPECGSYSLYDVEDSTNA